MDMQSAVIRLRNSRRLILDLIAGMDAEELNQPDRVDRWAIREVLAHITAWDEATLNPLAELIHARPWEVVPIADHNAWNAEKVEKRTGFSVEEVIVEMNAVREELIQAAEQTPLERQDELFEAPWGEQTTVAGMLSGLAWHEEEHVKEIRAVLR